MHKERKYNNFYDIYSKIIILKQIFYGEIKNLS